MPIEVYSPELFPILEQGVRQMGRAFSLAHKPFVDYYYASGRWSKLYLAIDETHRLVCTMGIEEMTFQWAGKALTAHIGTNFHAVAPGGGVGTALAAHVRETTPEGLIYLCHGGTEYTHRVVGHYKHHLSIPGIRTYHLNRVALPSSRSFWRRVAKNVWRKLRPPQTFGSLARRLSTLVDDKVQIVEESRITDEMIPLESPFDFRLAATSEYLNWRYRTDLSFVHYRIFRLLKDERTCGYVVVQDDPRGIMVAQCDGSDAAVLAGGVLRAVLACGEGDTRPRAVTLTCQDQEMQGIFERFGFAAERECRQFMFCSQMRSIPGAFGPGARLLVNLGWGDVGLQGPFTERRSDRSAASQQERNLAQGGGL